MSNLAATLPLYSSRPRIFVEGEENARLNAGVLSVSVHETEVGMYSCELAFGNWGSLGGDADFLHFDRQTLDFGVEITIEMGDEDASVEVFTGRITGIEGRFPQQRPPEILILAEDTLQDLRMTRRTRSFEETSLNDVIDRIASDHNLTAEIDIDSPDYKVLAQVNQSDLAFLRERARLVDAEVWVRNDILYVQSRSRRLTTELTLCYKQRLLEFSVLADLAHQRTHFAVTGWDTVNKETLEVEIDQSSISSELDNGLSGGSVLEEAFGRRRESVAHQTPTTEEETRSLAEAGFRSLARRFISGKGLSEGDGRIRVGTQIELFGLGILFSGKYYVNEAKHLYHANTGYRTHFIVERAGMGVS